MRHAWENGVFFTRWLPDLAFGYGYPFFVYREPAPLYAVLLPHLLGVSLPAASNLFYTLCIMAAGWFMFLWVKDVSGPRAGIVSAVAYMAAPYILIDALIRGNAPESLALPLFPFLLWMGRRWIIQGSVKTFLLSLFGLAFLSLSHNISLLIFTPLFLLYLLAAGWLQQLSWRRLLVRLLLLFGLGLGMTFFYTGGALLEMDEVTLSLSTTTRNNDFHFNFASWPEILAPAGVEDPNLLNPPLPIRLGWVPASLAIIGISTLFWKKVKREQRWHVAMMTAAAALFLFMALPISLPIWEKLPLIDFVQFPWRFIGRAALPVAFLAGAPFAETTGREPSLSNGRKHLFSQLALVAVVGLLILEALPGLYPRTCKENEFPTIQDVHAYEQATTLVGIDPEGSYFPRTVQKRPKGSVLEADYQAGETPQRFDMSALPDGATVTAEYDQLSARVNVNTPSPFIARYLSFAFPGWVATIDGQQVPITPSDPGGLITFTVPSGEHFVTVRWQSTFMRTVLSLVSFLALIGVGVTTVLLVRHYRPATSETARQSDKGVPLWPLVLLGIGLLLFKFLLVDTGQTAWHRSSPPPVAHTAGLTAGELGFEGYNLSGTGVEAGGMFDIDLAWRALSPTGVEYQSNVWLADADGLLWSDKETQRPRLYEDAPPTWEWGEGQWAWDSREVSVLAGTPPGQYDIVLTLFDLATLQPLTLRDGSGSVIGPTAVIGQIKVEMPDEAVTVRPQFSSGEIVPGTGLLLTGYNQDREMLAPGDEMLLTLFWEREAGSVDDLTNLQLVADGGEVVQSWQLPVTRSDFDLAQWKPGQTLRDQQLLRLAATLESGTYKFWLQDAIPLGQIVVSAPERIFEQPDVGTAADILFADSIRLAGYTLAEDPLRVEFVWSATDQIDNSYHVFVHLVDGNGSIVAQSDGQPAEWTRPTAGWVPGEYILDNHTLFIPQGVPLENLSLRVGWYDPDTGRRLAVDEFDFATLPLNE
jgi:hypothetical protein